MRKFLYSIAAAFLAFPSLALAHEVYVLPPDEIARAIATSRFDMIPVALGNASQFIAWASIACVTVFLVFSLSIFRPLEKKIDPFLMRMKKHAPTVARVTVGLGLLAGSYFQASYGPELPMSATFGASAPLVALLVGILGVLMITNVWARGAAIVALLFFCINVLFRGTYMLTYTNYLGEILVLIIGAHEGLRLKGFAGKLQKRLAPYSWVLIRVSFGIALIYASFFAKILHNNLALQVASMRLAGHPQAVAHYLGFEPHFLVLGAAIIEIIIGIFFVLGIEIRFTALFMEFWLMLSLIYFGESVWPHFILIGIPIALFMHGYDRYSLEGLYFQRGKREPVL